MTPVAYFAQFALDCPAVAMVTASHNENGWTGVKMGAAKPLTFGPDEMNRLKAIVLGGEGKPRAVRKTYKEWCWEFEGELQIVTYCWNHRGEQEKRLVRVLLEAPRLIAESIQLEEEVRKVAVEVAKARDVLYLGRGPMSALALEGALKLKAISYIHAEGYAAGELKHGPIALVDDQTPIIILAPFDSYFEKSASNMSEVMARGGQVVFITDRQGEHEAPDGARVVMTAPSPTAALLALVT